MVDGNCLDHVIAPFNFTFTIYIIFIIIFFIILYLYIYKYKKIKKINIFFNKLYKKVIRIRVVSVGGIGGIPR